MFTLSSIAAISFLTAVISAQAADTMKAFPPAEEDMVRYVLQLPKQDDESVFKVELMVGKTVAVDEVNTYFFGGKIEQETIEGWGYPRYTVNKLGPMAGTLMAWSIPMRQGGAVHRHRRRTVSHSLQQPPADRDVCSRGGRGSVSDMEGQG